MYEEAFNFTTQPFSILPGPSSLYWTDSHRQAFQALDQGIREGCPLVVITGEVGSGKTTLIRHFLDNAPENLNVGLLSSVYKGHILEWVLFAFDQPFADEPFVALLDRLQTFLVEEFAAGRSPVLIVDEAQHVTDEDLETLRLLLNVNAGSDLLLQIVLIGQPELRERLSANEYRQIVQRIGSDYHLHAMTSDETAAYIRHRLVGAGGSDSLFDDAAIEAIHSITQGVPRKINHLCDLCLASAYADDADRVDAALVASIIEGARESKIFRALTEGEEKPSDAAGISGREPAYSEASGGQTSTRDGGREEREAGDPITGDADTTKAADHSVRTWPRGVDGQSGERGSLRDSSISGSNQGDAGTSASAPAATSGGSKAGLESATGAGPRDASAASVKASDDVLAGRPDDVSRRATRSAAKDEGRARAAIADAAEANRRAGSPVVALPARRETKTDKPKKGWWIAAAAACVALFAALGFYRTSTDRESARLPMLAIDGSVLDLGTPQHTEPASGAAKSHESDLPPAARGAEATARPGPLGEDQAVLRPDQLRTRPAEQTSPDEPVLSRIESGQLKHAGTALESDRNPVPPASRVSTRVARAGEPARPKTSIALDADEFTGFLAFSEPTSSHGAASVDDIALAELRTPSATDGQAPTPHAGDGTARPADPADLTKTGTIAGGAAIGPPIEANSRVSPPHSRRPGADRLTLVAALTPENATGLVMTSPGASPFLGRTPSQNQPRDQFLGADVSPDLVPHPLAPRASDALAEGGRDLTSNALVLGSPAGAEDRRSGEDRPWSLPMRLAVAAPAPGQTAELSKNDASRLVLDVLVRHALAEERSRRMDGRGGDGTASGGGGAGRRELGRRSFPHRTRSGARESNCRRGPLRARGDLRAQSLCLLSRPDLRIR